MLYIDIGYKARYIFCYKRYKPAKVDTALMKSRFCSLLISDRMKSCDIIEIQLRTNMMTPINSMPLTAKRKPET